MGKATVILLCATALFIGAAGNVYSNPEEMPFYPGEKLVYTLNWSGIEAGEATLEVLPLEHMDGKPVYHFILKVKTTSWIDKLYKVRYRIGAFSDIAMKRSLLYTREQRKGKSKKEVTVHFDIKNNTAQYISADKIKPPLKIESGTFDPLSIFYYTRCQLKEGIQEIERHVTDGKRNFLWRVIVLKKETIHVNGQHHEAYVIEPDLQKVGDISPKSKHGTLRIWMSADNRRIPLKIQSTVRIGSFTAELVSAKGVVMRPSGLYSWKQNKAKNNGAETPIMHVPATVTLKMPQFFLDNRRN